MNSGMISKRYARALLQYAVGQKTEDKLFSEMKKLAVVFTQEPRLRVAMDNPMLSKENKLSLIQAAVENSSKQFSTSIKFIIDKKREKHLRFIALSYIELYCKEKNINKGKLVTATPVDAKTIEKMKGLIQKIKPGTLDFETSTDPDIGGGFVLYVDTYRLDASVRTQLSKIKQNLITENSKVS